MHSISRFKELAEQKSFIGWPVVGEPKIGQEIPYFGKTLEYQLKTPNGVENYTSILRDFGWVVVFGITKDGFVPTLCQWKPGVNQASWELPPGGIGKVSSDLEWSEVVNRAMAIYLDETGYGNATWLEYLGYVMIETSKFRGITTEDHGFKAHLFLAVELEKVREPSPKKNEIIEPLMVPLWEFKDILTYAHNLFSEASAVACAYRALYGSNILNLVERIAHSI